MPRITMQIPHNLGCEEATRRLHEQLPRFEDKVTDLEQQWQDHTVTFHFKAAGFAVNGTMAVEEAAANVDLSLPLAALLFKGMIEEGLRRELTTILA